MKTFTKLMAAALLLCMMLCVGLSAFTMAADAATVPEATIDMTKTASFTLYKYDFTNAKKDGVWDEDSFISTGLRETYVEDTLGNTPRKGATGGSSVLGNEQTSNGYAIKGVEYTILKVAEITTYTESVRDGHEGYNLTQVLYGFDKDAAADLLKAIGLEGGANRYTNADVLDETKYYYQSDTLNAALYDALTSNSTTVKNALEAYIAASDDAIVMDKTDENGKSMKRDLALGLYLVCETSVPEMVTSSTDPFLLSLPMSTVDGNEHSASTEGGHTWNYDVIVYPKNNTGIPTLEKTVREANADTGKNNGATDDIHDGYAHTATGSAGDVMEYQIVSTLPTITSKATSLTEYRFVDTLSAGLSYNRDVKIEIFTDKGCTDTVATWAQDSGKFTVAYSYTPNGPASMIISLNGGGNGGLDEINGDTENANGELYAGYSNYTLRVTYSATVNSDASVVYGEDGNTNTVVLTWKRTSSEYFDTLIDDCHVYTFGLDLTKKFSDMESEAAEEADMFKHVKFKIWNKTDGYWVTATRNDAEGVYYVTGHVTEEADATVFYPVSAGNDHGHIIVKGLEDDEYILTEIETANGYTLLKDSISVVITAMEDDDTLCSIYEEDILGVLQNDPRYAFDGGLDLTLANIPQVPLSHKLLTASATVDGNGVTMEADNGSANAIAPLTVVNTRGFKLPQTGEQGMQLLTVAGAVGIGVAAALLLIVLLPKKKREDEPEEGKN